MQESSPNVCIMYARRHGCGVNIVHSQIVSVENEPVHIIPKGTEG